METDQKNKLLILIITIIVLVFLVFFFVIMLTKNRKEKTGEPKTATTENATYEQENGEKYTKEDIEKQREDFYKKNPLAQYLPYYGDNFDIRYSQDSNNNLTYKVKIHVYLNNPSQLKEYKENYAKYKIEALDWIKSKGIDYTKLNLEWEPEDPKNISSESNYSPTDGPECKTCK